MKDFYCKDLNFLFEGKQCWTPNFILGKKKFSTTKKSEEIQIQKDLQMPQHSYLPVNMSFLCFIGH